MSQIVISHDFKRLETLLSGLGSKDLRKAVSRSIKRSIKTVGKVTSQQIRAKKLISMKAATLKSRLRVRDVTGSNKPIAEQYGELRISGRRESLARFYARRILAGKSALTGTKLYRVQVSGMGKPYLDEKKAFMIWRGAGASKVILARVANTRLPVEKQVGDSVAALVDKAGMLPELQVVAIARYKTELEANTRYYVAQAVERAKR